MPTTVLGERCLVAGRPHSNSRLRRQEARCALSGGRRPFVSPARRPLAARPGVQPRLPAAPYLGSGCSRVGRRATPRPPCASLAADALAGLASPPARDVAAATVAVVGATLLIKFFDTLEKLGLIDQKLSRKLVHTLAGPGFLLAWPLFSDAPYACFLATLVPALNGLRLVLVGTGAVRDERMVKAVSRSGDPGELLRGPLYYVLVLMAATAIYWRESPVGLVITALMCGGDGMADIVGRRLGASNPLPWNPDKSWAGSAAMLVGGFAAAMGLIAYFAWLGFLPGGSMGSLAASVGLISLVAAVVESLPINATLDDNLSVPVVAAAMGVLMLQVVMLL